MLNKYLRLMRFDKPAGIALLWAPTAWALWLANQGHPSGWLIGCFLMGTILMRAAGCVINDLADRNLDKHVRRTQLRPITHGDISILQAFILLGLLLSCAVWIALQLPILCWYEAWFAMAITILYPFCKRFFNAPQLLLGIAFSWGIPMTYAASGIAPDRIMALLILLNFCWIVAYDTIYALIDREDDLNIGIRSTAILFGSQAVTMIRILLTMTHGLWLLLGYWCHCTQWFYLGWCIGLILLLYQNRFLNVDNPAPEAMRAFLWNAWYGLVMWLVVMYN